MTDVVAEAVRSEPAAAVIRGWRYFRLDGTDTLRATRQPWQERTLTAECVRPRRAMPPAESRLSRRERAARHLAQGACTCGVYALKHPRRKSLDERDIVAEVVLWGHVVEHELGYRAEHCRIERLFAPPFAVPPLHERYDVDVEPQRMFAKMTGPDVTPFWTEGEWPSDWFMTGAQRLERSRSTLWF